MPGPRSNMHPQENYTEVFLSHARLYVFAEKYDIQPLKKLSRQKLQHTLAIYTLYPERVGDITTLLKYVYVNTAETIDGIAYGRCWLITWELRWTRWSSMGRSRTECLIMGNFSGISRRCSH